MTFLLCFWEVQYGIMAGVLVSGILLLYSVARPPIKVSLHPAWALAGSQSSREWCRALSCSCPVPCPQPAVSTAQGLVPRSTSTLGTQGTKAGE